MKLRKISTKLLLAVFLTTVILSSTIGGTTYYFAKKGLIDSGKLDIQHIVQGSVAILESLNEDVENGKLTREEAEEKARRAILGPKIKPNESGMIHDISKSHFLYKESSYVFAVYSDLDEALSPYPPITENDDNYEQSRKTNKNLIEIAQNTDPEKSFDTYDWKEPGQEPKEQIAYMTYFEPWDWNIGIGAYTSELYKSLNILKWITIGVTVGMTVIALLIFYFMTRGKFAVMSSIADGSQHIADGDLNVPEFPESEDEIGQLSQSFNTMTQNLRGLITHLQKTSGELVTSATNVTVASNNTHTSITDTNTAVSEIARGAVIQSEDVDRLSDNLETLNKSINRMDEHNQEIMTITNDSKQATENGMNIVQSLKNSNESSIKASKDINEGVTKLYDKILNITSITETIKSISSQTNLLALNASIEASRAGEHGKGFAVVADEVRKLAEESSKATLQIEQMIEEIETDTETTMKAMTSTVTATTKLSEDVDQVEKDFIHISDAVGNTASSIQLLLQEIEAASVQSSEMMMAMESVSAVTEETSASIEEISASIQEQLTALGHNNELAQNLSEISAELDELIQQYQL